MVERARVFIRWVRIYLQFLEGETTSSLDAAVVPNGRASHNWSELVNWARSNGGSLSEASLTTSVLSAGLCVVK